MKINIYLVLIFCCLIFSGCRKSSRNRSTRSRSNKMVVEKRDRGNNSKHKDNERSKSGDNENSVTDNDDDINVTPRSTDRRVTFWSANGDDNIEMLEEACDYNVPKTKGFANKLAGKAKCLDGTFNIEQICEIFDYCYTKWRYVNDPKGCEYLAKASETIASSLTGDCDDFAVLIAACMLAIGGDVCIVTAQGTQGGHAYAEVDISDMNNSHVIDYINKRFSSQRISNIVIRNDGAKKWLNLDWSGNYPGGPTFNAYDKNYYTCINGIWTFKK